VLIIGVDWDLQAADYLPAFSEQLEEAAWPPIGSFFYTATIRLLLRCCFLIRGRSHWIRRSSQRWGAQTFELVAKSDAQTMLPPTGLLGAGRALQ
jgi:hypothetical protein